MLNIGWDKQPIEIQAKNLAMFGYGQWSHRAKSFRTSLYARSIVIQKGEQQDLILCCLDLGCITYAMRERTIQRLSQYTWFHPEKLVLMATHTHSSLGGCSYEALYNMPTPGFVPEHVEAIVKAIVHSILHAHDSAQPTEIRLGAAHFDAQIPVAWNRSLKSYNRNPDVQPRSEHETHLALDRQMNVLGFYRDGKLHAFMSLFGVHATCLGNQLHQYDGDNKGYAAAFSEQQLHEQGIVQPVAIFAQSTAGDVSPHFHGKNQLKKRQKITGEAEYQYAQQNGCYQSDLAFTALYQSKNIHAEQLDAICQYIDLSNIDIDPEFSNGQAARTSRACHGAAFFAGTPVDGVGAAKPITLAMQLLSDRVRKQRLNPQHPQYQYYQALYASQGVKPIVLEAGDKCLLGQKLDIMPSILDPLIGEMNRQYKAGAIQESEMVAHIVPIQLLRIGEIALLCCAGEITTTAGKRLVATVSQQLAAPSKVLLASYCNDYMGYITTYEEYQQQAYEGGHTLFGQWTLAAFQTTFKALAQQFALPPEQRQYEQSLRPKIPPQHELDKRTHYGSTKTAVR